MCTYITFASCIFAEIAFDCCKNFHNTHTSCNRSVNHRWCITSNPFTITRNVIFLAAVNKLLNHVQTESSSEMQFVALVDGEFCISGMKPFLLDTIKNIFLKYSRNCSCNALWLISFTSKKYINIL